MKAGPALWVKELFMKSITISAAFVTAMAAGVALAQLPPVEPPVPPKGTVAQDVDDETITAKVNDAISSDPDLKDIECTVATTDGVVTLNGTANARDQIARAVALARAVDGVKGVTNILAVKTS
jgi:hyperosmotically inducible periplasmic protein